MNCLTTDEMCLGAGSVQLSTTQIICPKHRDQEDHFISKKKNPIHCNVSWCLLCSQGKFLFNFENIIFISDLTLLWRRWKSDLLRTLSSLLSHALPRFGERTRRIIHLH